MSEQEEEKGFVIRDRRGRGDGESSPSAASTPPRSDEVRTQAEPAQGSEHGPIPITFSSFVFSLGTSALMLMGESIDPRQPAPPMNLPQAKEIIDILSMLEGKTHGNLSSEEESVLRDMLYTLRMKYVSVTSSKPAS